MAKAAAGFSLIELVIALAIAGVTASLAFASYRASLLRAARTEAIHGLLAIAAEQEKFHLNVGRYADRLDAAPGAEPPGLAIASLTLHGRYRLAIESADAAGFVAVARAQAAAGQSDPACARLSIDESGRRRAEDARGRDATAVCW